MKATSVSYVILGMLQRAPRSGYEIKRIVDKSTRFFWAASYGQIYPELERLSKAGLIEGTEEPRGNRRRNVYRLTEAGRTALREWLRGPDVGLEIRDEGLLKLFFSSALPSEELGELIRTIRDARQGVLDRLREIEREGKVRPGTANHLVLSYGIQHYEWIVEWFEQTERRLADEAAAQDVGGRR